MHSILAMYLDKVAANQLQHDPVQEALARQLDDLAEELEKQKLASKSSSLGWLFNGRKKQNGLKGLYIWGSVGRGKSMLMDLFFSHVKLQRKRRVHFNDFMADAQERIQQQRDAYKNGLTKEEDPIPPVAREMAEEARLLCFDEFTVTDIADATILQRLFSGLFEAGSVVVATSNVAPDELYKDGLNRQRFLPFIDLLKSYCDVVELDARIDYRLEKLAKASLYNAPLNAKAEQAMESAWNRMTGGGEAKAEKIERMGRVINIPQAVDGVARFSFSDLCAQPLGAADYLAITKQYHTVFVDDVPVMGAGNRNEAKRFILLIDTLYDRGIKLVISAAANPHALYQGTSGTEGFEFQRTASRLIEMQSADYIAGIKDRNTA